MFSGEFRLVRQAHLRLGRRGEQLAAALMRELGFYVLTKNYSGRYGEIDLVVRHPLTSALSFVEVKTRRRHGRARPGAAVGTEKRGKIIKTAHRYLREIGSPNVVYRFDVVEVILNGLRLREVYYWPNAFVEEPIDPKIELRFPDRPAEFVRVL